MTKSIYKKPKFVEVLFDSTEVLCASNLDGGIDEVTRVDVDWLWEEE